MGNKFLLVFEVVVIATSSLLIGTSPVMMKNNGNDYTNSEPTVIIEEKFLYYDGVNITWYETAAFKLKTSNLALYIDPYLLTGNEEKADIAIATHNHFDHLSVPDLRKISDENTIIFCPKPIPIDAYGTTVEEVESLEVKEINYVKPGDIIEVSDITLEFVPAYNSNHPRDANWTGVVVDFGNVRVYHAGDTTHIPEMKQINCDIALLPIFGAGLMSDDEGAEAVESLQVSSDLKYAIPMHYVYPYTSNNITIGNLILRSEVETFKEKANCTVVILEPMKPLVALTNTEESTTNSVKTPIAGFSIISLVSLIALYIFTRKRQNRE